MTSIVSIAYMKIMKKMSDWDVYQHARLAGSYTFNPDCGYIRGADYSETKGYMFDCGHHFFKYIDPEIVDHDKAWDKYRELHLETFGTYPQTEGIEE